MPTTCTGSLKDYTACVCVLFVPKKSKSAKCKTCGHRASHHSDIPATSQDSDALPTTKPPGEKYVTRLFKSLEATAVHETAREEMLEGFRPPFTQDPAKPSKKSKGKAKGKQASTKVHSQKVAPGTVKLGRIVVFPCGDQNLQRFKFPTIKPTSLEPYINAGLATPAVNASGFVFQLDWGTKQFNAFLRTLFPTLFAYFDKIDPAFKTIPNEPDTIGVKRIKYSLPYVLLTKDYRKYKIVDNTHPTAAEYKEALSGEGNNAGFRAKSIFIVTKAPIPQGVLDEWFSPSSAPLVPAMRNTSPPSIPTGSKRSRNVSISISSNSSDGSQESSDYAPVDTLATKENEETDADEVKSLEKPQRKRVRVSSPDVEDAPAFIQGSSRDGEITNLARQLEQSASFDESYTNKVWQSGEDADLWNF